MKNFFLEKQTRNTRCKAKDKAVREILCSLKINNPDSFHALLMPCIHGPEVRFLVKAGVLPGNIFCLESDVKTHRMMKTHALTKDLWITPTPMKSSLGIDSVHAEMWSRDVQHLDFVYLDFFGAPSSEQAELFRKMKTLDVLKSGSVILVNQGKRWTRTLTKNINDRLLKPGEVLATTNYLKCLFSFEFLTFEIYTSRDQRNHISKYQLSWGVIK